MTIKPIVFVAATRPNFIKIAPLLREFDKKMGAVHRLFVHTGQHYDYTLSKVFFDQLGLPEPNIHFNSGGGTHGEQTARVLVNFESFLMQNSVRGVVVVGDVNSTIAAALAAVKLGIPVAHVESGLRSFDRTMPEEINRLLTDSISDILFVSESSGLQNLENSGIDRQKVYLVGNVMIDTLIQELPVARLIPRSSVPYALVTFHRPSNVDNVHGLELIIQFLEFLGSFIKVIFPVHPRTKASMYQYGLYKRFTSIQNLKFCEPLGYHENLSHMMNAEFVITDSGGIQEETSYLQVPCLTFRNNTERPSTITFGTNTLIGNDVAKMKKLVYDILSGRYKKGNLIPLWDGHTSERIVKILLEVWFDGAKS